MVPPLLLSVAVAVMGMLALVVKVALFAGLVIAQVGAVSAMTLIALEVVARPRLSVAFTVRE